MGVSLTEKPYWDRRFGFLLLIALSRFLVALSISTGFDELLIFPLVSALVVDTRLLLGLC